MGKQSTTSFEAVLTTIPDQVTADEANGGWSLAAPDNSARFIWSADYSKSPQHDVMLEFDAAPFTAAGMDESLLPDSYTVYGEMMMVGKKLGNYSFTYDGDPTPLAAYKQIVANYRDSIGFHTSLDHFGVQLGEGNLFEWAKDLTKNGFDDSDQDKDIVFVLNPEPFVTAGVDPTQVEGWVYAQVPVDENGKTVQVWKLLKPFNLK